jgi:hypothetical protein
VYAPEQTTYTIDAAELIGRNAILMTGMTYFGGLLILGLRKYLEDSNPHYRFVLPVVVDVLIMTPVSIWAAYTSHHIITAGPGITSWEMVVVWTYFCRILVPVLVLTYIMYKSEWQSDRIETIQEKVNVKES